MISGVICTPTNQGDGGGKHHHDHVVISKPSPSPTPLQIKGTMEQLTPAGIQFDTNRPKESGSLSPQNADWVHDLCEQIDNKSTFPR